VPDDFVARVFAVMASAQQHTFQVLTKRPARMRSRGDRFVARTGFDPRAPATPYRWFRLSPRRIQAWREVNELPDRELMRDGRWLV